MDGNAIILCEGAFGTPSGKTANGLVRYTKRYKVLCVIDSRCSGEDAGEVLDGIKNGIPVVSSLDEAIRKFSKNKPKYLVIGLAPDGGRLPKEYRKIVLRAIKYGLNIDSGLHDFLSEDEEFSKPAIKNKVKMRDIRKTPERNQLHFFTGEIKEVKSLKIAILGTDSAIGKRTTAVLLTNELQKAGISAEMIGTGQTAWMQGWEYTIILDSLINDFVSGELENVILRAWREKKPKVIIIEGQGCLTNPAYPGGFEILAATRPDLVILQHAPKRKFYDGFPGIPLAGLDKEMEIIKLLTRKKIFAIAINHEFMTTDEIEKIIKEYEKKYKILCFDPLLSCKSLQWEKKVISLIKRQLLK